MSGHSTTIAKLQRDRDQARESLVSMTESRQEWIDQCQKLEAENTALRNKPESDRETAYHLVLRERERPGHTMVRDKISISEALIDIDFFKRTWELVSLTITTDFGDKLGLADGHQMSKMPSPRDVLEGILAKAREELDNHCRNYGRTDQETGELEFCPRPRDRFDDLSERVEELEIVILPIIGRGGES